MLIPNCLMRLTAGELIHPTEDRFGLDLPRDDLADGSRRQDSPSSWGFLKSENAELKIFEYTLPAAHDIPRILTRFMVF